MRSSNGGTMRRIQRTTLAAMAGLMLTGAVVGGVSASTGAETKVTGVVSTGALTAVIDVVKDLGTVAYSVEDQQMGGQLQLTVDDATGFEGKNTGWHVTIEASDFDCSCGDDAQNIEASNFILTDIAQPQLIFGQQVDEKFGPLALKPAAFSLETARKVNTSDIGFGNGRYSQDLGVELTVPGMSRPATYTSLVTITYAAAP
jgi:hypothetical protein